MLTQKTEHLHIRISKELKNRVEALAKSKGLSLADLIRYLITKEMEYRYDN